MAKTRYCWLTKNYEFSKSWSQETHETCVDQDVIDHATKAGARLIKYQCVNDENFEFNDNMKMR